MPVPYNAGGMFATSDGTYVYTGAGGDINAGHNDLLRYDPRNNSRMSLVPSPDQHALSQAVYFKGRLYNMAGFLGDLSQVSDTTRIYRYCHKHLDYGQASAGDLGCSGHHLMGRNHLCSWRLRWRRGGKIRCTLITSPAAPGARSRTCHRH